MLRIGLAALRLQNSIPEGIARITETLAECRQRGVEIACFPELYLPGLRGGDLKLPPPDQQTMQKALQELQQSCRECKVAAIIGMEWVTERGLENRAFVISEAGSVLGYQTKNQITPGGESDHYVPDGRRQLFSVRDIPFGIVICHEGWRYPETVRWAAVRGAKIIFQPQWTGSDNSGRILSRWGDSFYEKAMECRAQENSVWFASVNLAMKYQNSATSLIDPQGKRVGYIPYVKEDLLVADIDPEEATRLYAKRFQPELYPD